MDWPDSHSAGHLRPERRSRGISNTTLAFLPDLTEEINTTIDYTASNVTDPQLSTDRRERLVATLKNHEHILIASGNALPPPAYGAVMRYRHTGARPN
ncbi:hypothetical protein PInf_024930 [Phytophthora infestans]|nr:hypothetical protein PInf_024930 [Phytophthora infestans]